MSHLLDTCVLSEFKKKQPEQKVIAWLDAQCPLKNAVRCCPDSKLLMLVIVQPPNTASAARCQLLPYVRPRPKGTSQINVVTNR